MLEAFIKKLDAVKAGWSKIKFPNPGNNQKTDKISRVFYLSGGSWEGWRL